MLHIKFGGRAASMENDGKYNVAAGGRRACRSETVNITCSPRRRVSRLKVFTAKPKVIH